MATVEPERAGRSMKVDGLEAPRRREREVVDAAARVFHERGYASATVQDVADALGMLKGSLYYYINAKEDLLYQIVSDVHDGVDLVMAEVAERDDLRALDRLALYVERQVEYHLRNLIEISVYYRDLDRLSRDRHRESLRRRKAHADYVASLIRQAQADGDADPSVEPPLAANFIAGAMIWTYRWYRPGDEGATVAELGEICARYAVDGIAAGVRLPFDPGRA